MSTQPLYQQLRHVAYMSTHSTLLNVAADAIQSLEEKLSYRELSLEIIGNSSERSEMQVEWLNNKVDELVEELDEKNKLVENLQVANKVLAEVNVGDEIDTSALNLKVGDLSDKILSLENELGDIHGENARLYEKYDELESELEYKNNLVEKQQMEIAKLQKSLKKQNDLINLADRFCHRVAAHYERVIESHTNHPRSTNKVNSIRRKLLKPKENLFLKKHKTGDKPYLRKSLFKHVKTLNLNKARF